MQFRLMAGNTTRVLNTVLVGLETLKSSDPVRPGNLALPWAKPSTDSEWTETQEFSLKSATLVVVDALDAYLKIGVKIDGYIDSELEDFLVGRYIKALERRPTIPERFERLGSHYQVFPNRLFWAILGLMVTWRNGFAHASYQHGLSTRDREVLEANAKALSEDFAGIDIFDTLARFDQNQSPNLKDLSVVIAAMQRMVADLDKRLLFDQEPGEYAIALTKYLLSNQAEPAVEIERIFRNGGANAAGRLYALLLEHGATQASTKTAAAPTLTREQLNSILGIGRNDAASLFGIERPRTGAGE